ncbi:MAG TPA: SDR family NAD(P)-dependent oxidoreductase [Sporichthyaceae bacterium]|jgi:NAD(P)-dependent dehydrogenase (short-subunit alcohol dehydrogenase family)|nr:SDR family NAD(P)-dependent oxidoreductase [Sporichthyaceae bacterium]
MSRRTERTRAVVTGAGSGIGQAFAVELARRGGHVVCADIDPVRAGETAELIGPAARAVQCDVASLEEVEALAKTAEAWFGGPTDLVVNNAGVGSGGLDVGELPIEDWSWVLGVNLWGVIHGCHVFTPGLRELGRGGIINVASSASFAAFPQMSAYNVSKAGVLALSETLAAELSGSGVAVTVVCSTFVKTNVVRDGRISGPATDLAERLIARTGMSAQAVARHALDTHDRGRLHALPQLHAKVLWHAKRHLPAPYTRALGLGFRLADKVAQHI